MRYLGIDYGQKRTGVAICDEQELIASPVTVIAGQRDLISHIARIAEREQVGAIVVGLPLNMDGSEGKAAKVTRKFGADLTHALGIQVLFHDERLSSFDAEQKLIETDFSRKKKKKRIDAIAAASILQSFLDQKSNKFA